MSTLVGKSAGDDRCSETHSAEGPPTQPYFSVCLPTYNRGYCLGDAIRSVLSQDFGDFELIVADNASTDDTQAVLRSLDDPRIRNARFETNANMWDNHNRCVRLANAAWIVFLHSDDNLLPAALANLHALVAEDSTCDIMFPRKELHHTSGGGVLAMQGPAGIAALMRWPAGAPSGVAYRAAVFERQRFEPAMISADLLLLIRALQEGRRLLIHDRPVISIAQNEQQCTHEWTLSGRFVVDVGEAISAGIANDRAVHRELARQICNWTPAEQCRLFMFLAHGGQLRLLRQLERSLSSVAYKRDRHYRHVRYAKLFGSRMFNALYLWQRSRAR